MSTSLDIGSRAPDFTMPTDGGADVSLASLAGKPFVLYFYPKDDTPGCTKEAIEFSAQLQAFAACGVAIIGVSKDPVAKHDKFKAKHDLTIQLASDADTDVAERYSVWVEKRMYGKTFMGLERATFLIDADGVIQKVWRKVRVPGHVDAVLEAAQALTAND